MDYEKKYKEAVCNIQKLLENGRKEGEVICAYEADFMSIFPELKESEDEKIRKGLIDMLKNDEKCYLKEIAWLERQGEQKQDPCEHCNDKLLNCHNFPCIKKKAFEQGKSALEAVNEEKVDNAEKKEPKKIEQNPWSEEDNFMYNKIKNLLTDISLAPESIKSLFDWLKDLKDRVQPQTTWKPSREQIMALRWVLNHIPYDSHKEEISGLLEQLKKLREE